MSLFSETIVGQVLGTLKASAPLVALVSGVYDHVPQEEVFPYVKIGELVETEQNTDDAEQNAAVSLTIHCYSRHQGRKEVHAIQLEINRALHRAPLAQAGFKFLTIDHVQSQSFTDADGLTRHGVSEFNILITEA